MEILALEEPKHQSIVIALSKLRHCAIQQRGHLHPDIRFGFVRKELHIRFHLAALPPLLFSERVCGGVSGRATKPAREDRLRIERGRFPRQNDEYDLSNFFRHMRIADPAQGDGIDQMDVPRNQRGKRFLGIALGVLSYERHDIGHHLNYTISAVSERLQVFLVFLHYGVFRFSAFCLGKPAFLHWIQCATTTPAVAFCRAFGGRS